MSRHDDDVLGIMGSNDLPIYETHNVQRISKVYLDEEIGEPSKYRSVYVTLDSAKEGDVVEFHLNTPGGLLVTAMQINNGILTSEAYTRAVCHGRVESAGTFIALACHEIVIMPGTAWMVHAPSWGSGGDLKSVRNHVEFETRILTEQCLDVYEGFLSEEEIIDMIENSIEYRFDEFEIRERLEKRNEVRKNRADLQHSELED